MEQAYAPGSLVRARGRDWIVLPGREPSVLKLRPLTRAQADVVGIYLPLEGKQISSADFTPPSANKPGDATGVMTLFNAARLSLRSGAAPFDRSAEYQSRPDRINSSRSSWRCGSIR